MSFNTWMPAAVSSEARPWAGTVWRMVEAQHTASTMKIVDNDAEQDLLETLLESSKPAQPGSVLALDYLLATPFRYHPLRGGSRFRAITDPGVFYGAESVRTASAELGYWRWRFLKDAVDLEKLEPVAHTAFSADVRTQTVDLRQPTFSADATAWLHPADYGATQAFLFYRASAGFQAGSYVLGRCSRDHADWMIREVESLRPSGRVWVVISHATNQARELSSLLAHLRATGRQLDHVLPPSGEDAEAYLFALNPPTVTAGTGSEPFAGTQSWECGGPAGDSAAR